MKQLITLIIIIALSIAGCSSATQNEEQTATLQGQTFTIEVADSNEERMQGLMFRSELCKDCGMLFIWEEIDTYSFWMKNTLIPLDILFIGEDLVVHTLHHAVPCKIDPCAIYPPEEPVKYVLEVNVNTFDESVIGQKITLQT